mmetsp:Transcript_55729/g.150285  ORF Transcript_55729/g.150285 Transcript_55729/m.150285 type:complete len:211 (+) Transcript_55729:465-1097(+)
MHPPRSQGVEIGPAWPAGQHQLRASPEALLGVRGLQRQGGCIYQLHGAFQGHPGLHFLLVRLLGRARHLRGRRRVAPPAGDGPALEHEAFRPPAPGGRLHVQGGPSAGSLRPSARHGGHPVGHGQPPSCEPSGACRGPERSGVPGVAAGPVADGRLPPAHGWRGWPEVRAAWRRVPRRVGQGRLVKARFLTASREDGVPPPGCFDASAAG